MPNDQKIEDKENIMADYNLQAGAVAPQQSEQTGSKKAVSLIDSLLSQPTLPQGTTITPQVQNVQTNELLSTPGVTGTLSAQQHKLLLLQQQVLQHQQQLR